MSVLLIGAGGVGSLLAAVLDEAGKEISLLGRGRHFELVRQQGIHADANGIKIQTSARLKCLENVSQAIHPLNTVILAVKSFDTISVLDEIQSRTHQDTVFISLQNGVDNEPIIKKYFPENCIIAGVINGHYSIPEPGTARWEGDYGALAGASFSGIEDLAKSTWLNLFGGSRLPQLYVEGKRAAAEIKWSKLVLNCGFNAINALTGLAPDQIISDPVQGKLATEAFQEAFQVMHALELEPIDLPGAQIRLIQQICAKPLPEAQKKLQRVTPKSSGQVASSMRQDVLFKRRSTEIAEINGAVVREGKRLSIPTPANQQLLEAFSH